ncbi:hypothetical protein ASPACDRAFT_1860579 [Aspergillus aculeatus ATCC 16872]|uniref:Uncharacterized protein n=1 Tax=Aspergillus aculeatus (strain ATCC 16872 / CBS 172.66 / WB 5094) TaxID=690307 RepID=A0A1L9WFD1_ASPA1|nr:uncharacterized protein ASPACDRAFT_1860579 [Aspergillus aculeatus ATCC 16872]OJJ94891.1 hypothetical protein ASPACDRAFT_1860579 [Aspergillus aculeatus ATCC 16872]
MPSNPFNSMYRAIRSNAPKNGNGSEDSKYSKNNADSKQSKGYAPSKEHAQDDSASILSDATTLAPRKDEQPSSKGNSRDHEEIDFDSVRYMMRGMATRH